MINKNTVPVEIHGILDDQRAEHNRIMATGLETCPVCQEDVSIELMTSSIEHGTTCQTCDMDRGDE